MFASKDALISGSGVAGYAINNSLRFRSGSFFSRTMAAGSSTSWTWSGWIKRGILGAYENLLSAPITVGSTEEYIGFHSDDSLFHQDGTTGTLTKTSAVFRDPSSWYHVVYVYDSTNATQSLRGVWYINGVQQANSTNAIGASRASYINGARLHTMGRLATISSQYFDGYFAETNFIGGSSLGPTNFGAFSTATGVWQPKLYTGSYAGTNSFYLNYSDTTALTSASNVGIGKDFSGNANYWLTNGPFSVTAGTTYDPMLDSPMLVSATVANYGVLNPLSNSVASTVLSSGNLNFVNYGSTYYTSTGTTFYVSSGKWYFEAVMTGSGTVSNTVGVHKGTAYTTVAYQTQAGSVGYTSDTGAITLSAVTQSTGATWTYGDIIGVAFDMGAGTVQFYKNGTATGSLVTGISGSYTPAFAINYYAGSTISANFGQRAFSGVPANSGNPPSGFVALNAYNLPTPTIANGATVMAATAYPGNSSTNNLNNGTNTTTAVSFKPDFVWIKNRTTGLAHYLSNSVTGVYQVLFSNLTSTEYNGTSFSDGVSSFNTNGFTLLNGSNVANYNQTANNYVAWQWQAGQGSSSPDNNGSIPSTTSVNATAGFSVVTYTGNLSASAGTLPTVGHGLNAVPSMIISKSRNVVNSDTGHWCVQHVSLAASNVLFLDLTSGQSAITGGLTSPALTYFYTQYQTGLNITGNNIVAYCWSPVAGYSAFGSYTGNGSSTDGTFIYLGFRARWVMIKRTDSTGGDWCVVDTSRDPYNVASDFLYPNLAVGSQVNGAFDILSNGIKMRNTFANLNASTVPYIYAAFAENPFKYALAR